MLGFLTHRARLHEYGRPLVAYVRGDTGGCSLPQAFAALNDGTFQGIRRQLRRSGRILSRTPEGLLHIQTDRTTFWAPSGTDWAYVLAEQAVRVYGDGPHRVQRGNVVLDSGANIGAFTREALDAGARLVVAIEPVPANVESLRRTFRTELEQGRVRIVDRGVWNKVDVLVMNLFDNSALDSFVMPDRPEGEVSRRVSLPLTTIDLIVDELRLEQVDFIKMDIEGAERQALEGARRTIQRYKPRLSIATENLPDDYEVLPKVVAEVEPSYRWVRGPCSFTDRFDVRPETLYFFSR